MSRPARRRAVTARPWYRSEIGRYQDRAIEKGDDAGVLRLKLVCPGEAARSEPVVPPDAQRIPVEFKR
jgi:hypothetical protein